MKRLENLWKDNILYQSENLVETYKNKLIDLSMLVHAQNATEDGNGATGGLTQAETNKHFAERFLTSAARIQYITINPRGEFNIISNDLQTTFLGGNISVLDIPAGTGAGILALLCNIAELRASSCLPKLPLHIYLTGGDISIFALNIYSELLNDLKQHLAELLIYVHHQDIIWDATDISSTDSLLNNWFAQNTNSEEYYILVPAFSGVGSTVFKKFEESFRYIQGRISNKHATITFVEPNMNEAGIFMSFINKIIKKIALLLPGSEESTEISNRFSWWDPIRGNTAKSGVKVLSYYRK